MTGKPIVPRRAAEKDVGEAVDYYLREAGGSVALAFIDAIEATYALIAEHPAAGSPRFAHELGLEGLRSRAIRGFPYVAFYVERADQIDLWRVLDGRRDVPAWLDDPDSAS